MHTSPWPGYYRSVCALCQQIGEADIVVTGGDDMFPDGRLDAQQIAEQFFERFPDGFGVMQPTGDDLWGTDLVAGSPWLGSAWVREAYRGSGPLCQDYMVWFGDQELKLVAERLGVFWPRPDLVQRHEHWWRTRQRKDYQKRNQQLYWQPDQKIFEARLAADFPGHERAAHV